MDILRPKLLWIGKRCYRVNDVANDSEFEQQTTANNEYIEDDLYGDEDDAEAKESFEVIEVSPNRYKTAFHVPQAFYGAIIGAKGSVKKRIEGETRTDITIPKHGSSGDITILGTKRDLVTSARRRIELIVSNCRRKQPRTHFTCVRLTEPAITTNYLKFKEEILKSGPTLGLQEDMFIRPEKLHITIGAMCLMDDVDRSLATDLLNECRDTIVLPIKNEYGKIEVSVRGVEIMNDDPSSVRVLYGIVQSDVLQQIADGILNMFLNSDLAKREFDRDHVKMHMTLIKAKSAGDDDDGVTTGKLKHKTFDARSILKNYAHYDFGCQTINEIHLAVLKSNDNDGFYKCTTSIQF